MSEKQTLLQIVIDHPRAALIAALILGGLSVSGKFSVTATRILFFAAWVVAVFSFYGFFDPIFFALRKSIWMFVGCSIGFGLTLFLLAAWAQPEAVPLNFGVLIARRPILLWSTKEPKTTMEFGDSGAAITWEGARDQPMFKFVGESELKIEMARKKLLVSTKIMDAKGNQVAELIRNEWKVSSGTWDRNYTDDALEVKDNRGQIVLQVKVLMDRIQLQGEWWDTHGYGIRIVKCRDPRAGKIGGCIVVMTPTTPPDRHDPVIEPIFRYPSELHFGELIH